MADCTPAHESPVKSHLNTSDCRSDDVFKILHCSFEEILYDQHGVIVSLSVRVFVTFSESYAANCRSSANTNGLIYCNAINDSQFLSNRFSYDSVYQSSTVYILNGKANHVFCDNYILFCPSLPGNLRAFYFQAESSLTEQSNNITLSQIDTFGLLSLYSVSSFSSQFDTIVSNYGNIPYLFDQSANSAGSIGRHNAVNNTQHATYSLFKGFFQCGSNPQISDSIFIQNAFDAFINLGSPTFLNCLFFENQFSNGFGSPTAATYPTTNDNVRKGD
jgi:hypothetical protein